VTAPRKADAPASREIFVWTIPVGGPLAPGSSAAQDDLCLSPDERARAVRFRFDRDRRRFVACRVALRTILGRRLDVPASEVRFEYGAHGKPALARGADGLEFNVSHREDVAVIALTEGRRIGVDVEHLRKVEDAETLAARFFSSSEQESLRSVADSDRDEAFLACWTRKEAFVKALGEGLSLPLDSFSVSLAPDAEPALLGWAGREDELRAWALYSWRPAPGYLAAVAVEGPPVTGNLLRVQTWP
jgi:4'-phosphopantetheinyl transferase